MKEAWRLWKLVRLLRKNRGSGASASINLVQEQESASTYRELAALHASMGWPVPEPRQAWEVAVWLDTRQSSKVHRGHTLAEALESALAGK